MSTNTDKKEKSLAEFIMIVTLIGIMMAVFINFYLKNESQFTQAGFAAIAQTFNIKVNTVHAQWMMDNQPNVVYLSSLNEQKKQAIPVNKTGWVDIQQERLTCEKIWLLVMETPLNSMSFPISAIEVHTAYNIHQEKFTRGPYDSKNSQCRYILLDGSYFQYNRSEGKVSRVRERE